MMARTVKPPNVNACIAGHGAPGFDLIGDALGRRIEKKDHVTSANTRRYFYSKDWQVLDEYNFSDTLACRQAEPARSKLGMGALTMPSDSIAQRAIPQFCTFSFAFCISADHLYSVAAEINTSSAVTERYEYDAYGNPHVTWLRSCRGCGGGEPGGRLGSISYCRYRRFNRCRRCRQAALGFALRVSGVYGSDAGVQGGRRTGEFG